MALNYLGYSLNTLDPAELAAAKELLINQRKQVKPLFGIDELKDKYVSGELVAGVVWSGDHAVCQQKMEEGARIPKRCNTCSSRFKPVRRHDVYSEECQKCCRRTGFYQFHVPA